MKQLSIVKMRFAKLEGQLHETQHDVYALRKVMSNYFTVDADVGHRGNNTIILTGIYRGKGHVQFYDVGQGQFAETVERMRDMNRCNLIRNIDAPPSFIGQFDLGELIMYENYGDNLKGGSVLRALNVLTERQGEITIIGGKAGSGKNMCMRMLIEMNEIDSGEKSIVLLTESRATDWLKYPSCTNATYMNGDRDKGFEHNMIQVCRVAVERKVKHVFVETIHESCAMSYTDNLQTIRDCIKYFGVSITAGTHMKSKT